MTVIGLEYFDEICYGDRYALSKGGIQNFLNIYPTKYQKLGTGYACYKIEKQKLVKTHTGINDITWPNTFLDDSAHLMYADLSDGFKQYIDNYISPLAKVSVDFINDFESLSDYFINTIKADIFFVSIRKLEYTRKMQNLPGIWYFHNPEGVMRIDGISGSVHKIRVYPSHKIDVINTIGFGDMFAALMWKYNFEQPIDLVLRELEKLILERKSNDISI